MQRAAQSAVMVSEQRSALSVKSVPGSVCCGRLLCALACLLFKPIYRFRVVKLSKLTKPSLVFSTHAFELSAQRHWPFMSTHRETKTGET